MRYCVIWMGVPATQIRMPDPKSLTTDEEKARVKGSGRQVFDRVGWRWYIVNVYPPATIGTAGRGDVRDDGHRRARRAF